MLDSILLPFLLPCLGLSAVFLIYLFLLCDATSHKGLSASELEKLPRITGKELVTSSECAVCLDEIENEQPARQLSGCNHAFHAECIDTWLSMHPLCPVCRAKPGLGRVENGGCIYMSDA